MLSRIAQNIHIHIKMYVWLILGTEFAWFLSIQGCVLGFLEEIKINRYIFDSNSTLLLFCQSLERIFSDNLLSTYNKFGFGKRTDAWQWLEKVPNDFKSDVSYNYSNCVENAKVSQRISNNGRLRLLIRLCLTHKCIHVPFEYLVSSPSVVDLIFIIFHH